jgi:hypothetical protein
MRPTLRTMNNMLYLREALLPLCFEAVALVVLFAGAAPRLVFDAVVFPMAV